MISLKLKAGEAEALRRIAAEHAERIGKRKSVPVGRTVFDVAYEIALCERLAVDLVEESEPKGQVIIGKREPVGKGPK